MRVPRAEAPSAADSLPSLIGRLGEDLTSLVDSKLALLKLELQEDLRSYIRGGVRALAGGMVATVGVALVSVGVALMISTLLGKATDLSPPAAHCVGFVAVGLLLLLGGIVVAARAARGLKAVELAPERSVQELEKDREWLRPGSS